MLLRLGNVTIVYNSSMAFVSYYHLLAPAFYMAPYELK